MKVPNILVINHNAAGVEVQLVQTEICFRIIKSVLKEFI